MTEDEDDLFDSVCRTVALFDDMIDGIFAMPRYDDDEQLNLHAYFCGLIRICNEYITASASDWKDPIERIEAVVESFENRELKRGEEFRRGLERMATTLIRMHLQVVSEE